MVQIFLSSALIVVGLVFYFFVSQGSSITALIPTFLGIPMLLLGFAEHSDKLGKGARFVAPALALLGFLGSAGGLVKFFSLISGADIARPNAVIAQALVAILCMIYLGLSVKSFRGIRPQHQ